MNKQIANTVIISALICALFFISGYHNKVIKQQAERIEQLETHHK